MFMAAPLRKKDPLVFFFEAEDELAVDNHEGSSSTATEEADILHFHSCMAHDVVRLLLV